MNNSDFVVFAMLWLANSAPVLVSVLQALVPVLAVCVAGYALYVGKK